MTEIEYVAAAAAAAAVTIHLLVRARSIYHLADVGVVDFVGDYLDDAAAAAADVTDLVMDFCSSDKTAVGLGDYHADAAVASVLAGLVVVQIDFLITGAVVSDQVEDTVLGDAAAAAALETVLETPAVAEQEESALGGYDAAAAVVVAVASVDALSGPAMHPPLPSNLLSILNLSDGRLSMVVTTYSDGVGVVEAI